MKELSIEEKAKRYDEAIEKLQNAFYDDNNRMCEEYRDACKRIIEPIFPELKESEDERIRKTLVAVVNLYYGEGEDEEKTACLAWLEKQGEYNKFRDSIQVGDKVTRNEEGILVNLSQLNRVAKKDKKQGEQKPIKIPRFKSGDTIEFNGFGHNRYTIKDVCGTTQYINSNGGRMDMSYTDANFKLVEQKPVPAWMPKFLDELRSKKNYFDWDEHKDIEGQILAVINWMNPNYFNEKDGKQKADKVEPKFKVGDVIRLKGTAAEYTIKRVTDTTYYTDGWSCGIERCEEDYELVEQKPAWSEEDEKIVNLILCICSDFKKVYSQSETALKDADKIESFLESLKDRYTWKPSKEQMEALEHFIVYHNGSTNYAKDLEELRLQLKKLKE